MTILPKPKREKREFARRQATAQPCAACGVRPPNDPDHVTSKGSRGGDTENNLMPLCRLHHSMRHQKGILFMARVFPGYCHWLVLKERWDVFEKMARASERLDGHKNADTEDFSG